MPIHTNNTRTPTDTSVPNVVIETGEITFDDNRGKYLPTAQPAGSIITDYQVRNRYFKDRNIFLAGVTSPNGFGGSSVSAFQLATPTLIWVSEWTACRIGIKPKIPDPIVDSDWILLDEYYEPYNLGLGPDGISPVYRLSGTYIYGKLSPNLRTVNDIVFPSPPWLNDSGIDRTVTPEDMQGGIIDIERTISTAPGVPGPKGR